MSYVKVGLASLAVAGIACSAVGGDAGTSTANVVASPLGNVKLTKVATLAGTAYSDYTKVLPVDATHVLLFRYDGSPGPSREYIELVDTTTGSSRDLGSASTWWGDVSTSPDGKWVVAEKDDGNGDILYGAGTAGAQAAIQIGRSTSLAFASPWPTQSFVGDKLIVMYEGVLHAYDPGTGKEHWQVAFTPARSIVQYAVSQDGARILAFTDAMGAFIDVADGKTQTISSWGGRLNTAQFEPGGTSVLGVIGDDPSARLVRLKLDGGAAVDVGPSVARAGLAFSADGKKVVYRVISGAAQWFSWPTGFVIRDLETNTTTELLDDWLGGRYLSSDSDPVAILADGHTAYATGKNLFFDMNAPGAGPVDIVPTEIRDPHHGPVVKRVPGDTGFMILPATGPATYFRRMDTGVTSKLGFTKGKISSVDVPRGGHQSAIVTTNKNVDGFDAQWLVSLTDAQKCIKLSAYAWGWANGFVIGQDRDGLVVTTIDGRFTGTVDLGKATKTFDRRPLAIADRSVFVEKDNALFRIDLPDYTPPAASSAPVASPDDDCDQTAPVAPGDDAGALLPPDLVDAGTADAGPEPTSDDAGNTPPTTTPPSTTTPSSTTSPTKPSAPWPTKSVAAKDLGAQASQPVAASESGGCATTSSRTAGDSAATGILGGLAILAARRRRRSV